MNKCPKSGSTEYWNEMPPQSDQIIVCSGSPNQELNTFKVRKNVRVNLVKYMLKYNCSSKGSSKLFQYNAQVKLLQYAQVNVRLVEVNAEVYQLHWTSAYTNAQVKSLQEKFAKLHLTCFCASKGQSYQCWLQPTAFA